MDAVTPVVLAAGRSSRTEYFNKLTSPLGGHPMVWYAVDNLRRAGLSRPIVVVGHDQNEVQDAIGGQHGAIYIRQDVQLGTANAVQCALPLLESEHVLVLYGDCPFIDEVAIQETLRLYRSVPGIVGVIATAQMRDPRHYGRVHSDDSSSITKIVEYRDARGNGDPNEVFAGLSIWSRDFLFETLPQLPAHQKGDGSHEFHLTDLVEFAHNANRRVLSFSNLTEHHALGPNTHEELETAYSVLLSKVRERLRNRGVSLFHSQTINVDYDVEVGSGSRLHRNVNLRGRTRIAEDCTIGPDATLVDCTVESNCEIGRGHWERVTFPKGSKATDKLSGEQMHFHLHPYAVPVQPRSCFVVLPFRDPFMSRYVNVIKPSLKKYGIECEIAADEIRPGIIIEDIWRSINRASFVIAETSDPNENVWYEIGLAHALNKPVVLLRDEKAGAMPFDVKHQRMLIYNVDHGTLVSVLDQWLERHDTWLT